MSKRNRPGRLQTARPRRVDPSSEGSEPTEEGPSPILVAEGVAKLYRTEAAPVRALVDLSLTIMPGEFVAVMGPSGSGKTTLLNCLSGLDDIDSGTVEVQGENIHRMSDARRSSYRARKMGFIFQSFNLIPVFSALENTELPLLLAGASPAHARSRARETLDRVGLGARQHHRPNELSGGEQQRVTIARALAGSPSIVWADEPTGNLDSETAASIMDLLVELNTEGMTLMLVTHDAGIGSLAGRIILMRDGAIERSTKAEPERRPPSRRKPVAGTKIAGRKTPAAGSGRKRTDR